MPVNTRSEDPWLTSSGMAATGLASWLGHSSGLALCSQCQRYQLIPMTSSRLLAWLFQQKFLMQKLGWSAVLKKTSHGWNFDCFNDGLEASGVWNTPALRINECPWSSFLRPFGKLYAQQRRCFWGVSRALLMRRAGMFGPRFLPEQPSFAFDWLPFAGTSWPFLWIRGFSRWWCFWSPSRQWRQVKGYVRLAQNGWQLDIQWQLIRGIPFQGSHPFWQKHEGSSICPQNLLYWHGRVPWRRQSVQMVE